MWFARGRLWQSQDEAARRRLARRAGERRGPAWRPGGDARGSARTFQGAARRKAPSASRAGCAATTSAEDSETTRVQTKRGRAGAARSGPPRERPADRPPSKDRPATRGLAPAASTAAAGRIAAGEWKDADRPPAVGDRPDWRPRPPASAGRATASASAMDPESAAPAEAARRRRPWQPEADRAAPRSAHGIRTGHRGSSDAATSMESGAVLRFRPGRRRTAHGRRSGPPGPGGGNRPIALAGRAAARTSGSGELRRRQAANGGRKPTGHLARAAPGTDRGRAAGTSVRTTWWRRPQLDAAEAGGKPGRPAPSLRAAAAADQPGGGGRRGGGGSSR